MCAACLVGLWVPAVSAEGEQQLEKQTVIVAVGAAGNEEYGQLFSTWADLWQAAASHGQTEFRQLGRQDDGDDLAEFSDHVSRAIKQQTAEPLWVVLIGHGTFDGRTARFNLRGKDLSAAKLNELLKDAERPVAVINCTSCSSPFINAVSGPNRIVITGTKDGSELQFARFGGYIADAIGKLEADIDRDGQTSLLEAWLHAARATEQFYEADGRLATEHSLLDDNGDGKGTRFEVFEGIRVRQNVSNKERLDGKLAADWHLIRSDAERSLSPEQRQRRNQLEAQLEELRQKKAELSESEYLQQLERILLPLARLYDEATSTD